MERRLFLGALVASLIPRQSNAQSEPPPPVAEKVMADSVNPIKKFSTGNLIINGIRNTDEEVKNFTSKLSEQLGTSVTTLNMWSSTEHSDAAHVKIFPEPGYPNPAPLSYKNIRSEISAANHRVAAFLIGNGSGALTPDFLTKGYGSDADVVVMFRKGRMLLERKDDAPAKEKKRGDSLTQGFVMDASNKGKMIVVEKGRRNNPDVDYPYIYISSLDELGNKVWKEVGRFDDPKAIAAAKERLKTPRKKQVAPQPTQQQTPQQVPPSGYQSPNWNRFPNSAIPTQPLPPAASPANGSWHHFDKTPVPAPQTTPAAPPKRITPLNPKVIQANASYDNQLKTGRGGL